MCGICGRVSVAAHRPDDSAFLAEQMMRLLEHRGPDDSGLWSDQHASLGHKRLAIIDLSAGGHEPMISEDGTKILVFNGEIYNFQEIKKAFPDLGYRFNNDPEVLLKLYEKFGEDCLRYLRGMFAFAIWDSQERNLFFARDRAGKKPFYYSLQNDTLIFASELRALLVNPEFTFQIDEESIFHYLTLQYIPSPRTIFKRVFKLPPAHFGVFENGKLRIERYWQLKYEQQNWTKEEAMERLEELLKESVRLRMISDVPLGAFLSGGIDSSSVVALMSELSARPVKTFTIRFEEEEFSEAEFARSVARRFETEHEELTVKPEYTDVLSKLVWHYSEPFADSSAIPFYYLSQMTAGYVKVALSGDGGDELFGGYPRYQFAPSSGKFFPAMFAPLFRHIPVNIRYAWRLRKYVDEGTLDLPALYLQKICYFNDQQKGELFTPEFAAKTNHCSTVKWFGSFFQKFSDVPFPQNLMAVDTETYLPDDLLVKADVASMACSLEARSPFLDHELMEFAASLPVEWKIENGTSKAILKRAMSKRLPPEILERPKMGFGVPIKLWFRKELASFVREILLSPSAASRGYFRPSAVEKLIHQHNSELFDNTYKLYSLLILELWHRVFIDDRHHALHSSPLQTITSA
jgi:asparagine synthase (glutamine-hydrolysing)